MTAYFVYLMCALTSVLCTVLLYQKYKKRKVRLLFLSAICFGGLAVSNIVLFLDLLLGPSHNLAVFRTLPALLGLVVLNWGLIKESV